METMVGFSPAKGSKFRKLPSSRKIGTGQCHMGVLQMSKQIGKNVKKRKKE